MKRLEDFSADDEELRKKVYFPCFKNYIKIKTKQKSVLGIRIFTTKRSLFLIYNMLKNPGYILYYHHQADAEHLHNLNVSRARVPCPGKNVLITNKGGKFQSMQEVADVSTIITSSKSNQDEN